MFFSRLHGRRPATWVAPETKSASRGKLLRASVTALALSSSTAFASGHGGEEAKKEEADAAAAAAKTEASEHYVHHWVALPTFSAARLPDNEMTSVSPKPGRMLIVIFLASWCEPCQHLLPEFRRLEKRFARLSTDFVYLFAHDTLQDATGFMREFGLNSAYLAGREVLKTYHNPELPTIYVGDRRGWLTARFTKTNPKSLNELERLLQKLTAF